jgi:hypothetical protein
VAIKAVGFNFRFELVFQDPAVGYVLDRFLNTARVREFGESVEGAGFKLLAKREDHLLQISVDPVWGNQLALAALINYHHDSPGEAPWSATVEKYKRFVADAPEVIRRLLSA